MVSHRSEFCNFSATFSPPQLLPHCCPPSTCGQRHLVGQSQILFLCAQNPSWILPTQNKSQNFHHRPAWSAPIAFCPQLFPFSPSSLPHRPLAISRTFQEGSLLDFFAFASPLARTRYPTAHFVKLPSFYSVSQFSQAFPDTPDTSAPSAPCVVCP